SPFLLAHTHLTFPHHSYDDAMRLVQIRKITRAIESYLARLMISDQLLPSLMVFIIGDLNGEPSDHVIQHLVQEGYRSSFSEANGREVKASHHNHLGRDVGVDYIWYKEWTRQDVLS